MTQPAPAAGQVNAAAIISLVIGIVAVVIGLFVSVPIGAILGLVAVGVGAVGRQQAGLKGGLPLAIAGIVLGWVAVAIQLIAAFID
jgi:hypothetical protein